MTNHIEIFLKAEDDDAIVQPLIDFFDPIAPTTIHKPELVFKSIEPVQLILTIATTWAAERFVLAPLADRAEEWWKGVSFLWKQSNARRQLGITINFQFPTDKFQVIIDETSDPGSLKLVWNYVQQASELYAQARDQEIQIDKIRLIPDGTSDMLVIAYNGNRPIYVADLKAGTLKPIRSLSSEESSKELWMLSTDIRRYDYLKMLVVRGRQVSEEEIHQLKSEIDSRKGNLRSGS